MTDTARSRPFMTGLLRGLRHRCPDCGEGRLYRGYLKIAPACNACGHDLGAYRADDGPAYFTILLLGHLVVAPMFFFRFMWEASPWLIVPGALGGLTALVLILLPRIKGAFVGALWAIRPAPAHGQDGTRRAFADCSPETPGCSGDLPCSAPSSSSL